MQIEQRIIATASAAEAATGLGLIAVPSIVVGMLLGADLEGTSVVLSRVTGIALTALTIACWPDTALRRSTKPYAGMLLYNLAVAFLLVSVGLAGERSGILLWPVAMLHLGLSALLGWAYYRMREGRKFNG